MPKKKLTKKQASADIVTRWPVCLACGQPRENHTDEEEASGCRRQSA